MLANREWDESAFYRACHAGPANFFKIGIVAGPRVAHAGALATAICRAAAVFAGGPAGVARTGRLRVSRAS